MKKLDLTDKIFVPFSPLKMGIMGIIAHYMWCAKILWRPCNILVISSNALLMRTKKGEKGDDHSTIIHI